MAPIFPIEQREEIQRKLLETGISLIRQKGIRHMTVDDVTKQVGIGKGTFYHFFQSKEEYVYEVICFSKENLLKYINNTIEQSGGIDKKSFQSFFEIFSFTSSNNIVSAMTADDEEWLRQKLPDKVMINPSKEDAIASLLLKNMIGVRKNINPHIIENSIKIMAMAVENKENLHQDALEETLSLIQKQICEYIFSE